MKRLQGVPIVSGILVGINVLVFFACHFIGDALYEAGILWASAVLENREYGRILWAMFLHGDIGHLFNNMVILFFLGAMIEKEIGHVRYGVLYFLSGIGGNLLSLLVKAVTDDMTGSIGASGAVFGLDGALLAMVLLAGRRMEDVTPGRVIFMVVYSLYAGFSGENIDNAAHVGGLIIGFGVAAVICMVQRMRDPHVDVQPDSSE